MYITYLGTAAYEGVPAIFCECDHCRHARAVGGKEVRMRSGAIVDGVLKIDFSFDAYAQSLRFNVPYTPVEHILITHSHGDHFDAEQLSMICPPYSHRKVPLTVYGNATVGEKLKPYLKEGKLAFKPVQPFETYEIGGYSVTPLPAVHCKATDEEPLIFLIEKDHRRLLYVHDTDLPPAEVMTYLNGKRMDLISLDCTNGILPHSYIGHMGIEDNLALRNQLIQNGTADENTAFVANHFSHNGLVSHEELEKRLPGFTVAFDGLTLPI